VGEHPEYLTVPEVMARLRLGRTTVYEQARLYLATDGAEGLPCRRFGRLLRFPAAALDLTGGEPAVVEPAPPPKPSSPARTRRPTTPSRPTTISQAPRRRSAARSADQPTLPFTG
jgi:hypothetical protein